MVLLICLQVASQLLVNTLWHQVAKLANMSISFRQMLYINCQGAVVDAITPGVKFGGEVTRAVQISRTQSCTGQQAAIVVAMQKLFSLSALFIIFLFTVGLLIGELPLLRAGYLQFLLYGVLIFLILSFLGILLAPHYVRTYLQKVQSPRSRWRRRVRDFILTLLEKVETIRKTPKRCGALFLLAFLIWLLYPAKLYLLVIQFVPNTSAAYVWSVAFLAYMVAMVPIFPGGIGGFEGTMTGLLVAIGFMINDAAVITVLFRFVTFWLVILLSLVFIAFRKFKCKKGHEAAP